jgi:hypothetical protein
VVTSPISRPDESIFWTQFLEGAHMDRVRGEPRNSSRQLKKFSGKIKYHIEDNSVLPIFLMRKYEYNTLHFTRHFNVHKFTTHSNIHKFTTNTNAYMSSIRYDRLLSTPKILMKLRRSTTKVEMSKSTNKETLEDQKRSISKSYKLSFKIYLS